MRVIEKLSEAEDKWLDPTKLQYRLRNSLRKRIESAINNDHDKSKEDLRQELNQLFEEDESSKQLLSYDQVSQVHKLLQRLDSSYFLYFFEFLDECRVFVPEERSNKELEARLKQLQLESSKKAYECMTGSVLVNTKSKSTLSSLGSDIKSIRKSLIAIFNSALVVAGTFVFVYKAVEYSRPEPDVTLQVFSALIASIVVAMAELYFLAKIM